MGIFSSVPSIPTGKTIVIVGAGYGGVALAKLLLADNANFIIINASSSFYHCLGAVRATSEPGWAEKLYINLPLTFGSHFKQGKVVNISPVANQVLLENGEFLTYDILVLATGSFGDLPFKPGPNKSEQDVLEVCHKTLQKLKSGFVERVAIIGGGPVGVEVAGEIATDFKDIQVTLFHPSENLISGDVFTDKFQMGLRRKLVNKGVRLVLGERVVSLPTEGVSGPFEIKTDKGTTVMADLVYKCIGVKVATDAYKDTLKSVMEKNGQVKVNKHLQVEGQTNIFALGDCCNTQEFKTAYRAGEHAKVLHRNIHLHLNNQPLAVYDTAAPSFAMGMSIGRNDAIGATMNGYTLPTFMLVSMKSKDLMLSKFYGELNQKAPN